MGVRTRVNLAPTFDNGSFARFSPFGDKRDVVVRRGPEMGTYSYGIEQGVRTVTLAGVATRIVRYGGLLSPPPRMLGASPVDPSGYATLYDVVYLPDAEVLLDRGPDRFSDAEVEQVLAAIVFEPGHPATASDG